MAEPFLSEIKIFTFGFPPRGWALCNGQTLPINQNQALFSLLGTTYGGDGRVNFQLPNLQGQVAISSGQGFVLGEAGGEVAHTLTINEIPQHSHPVNCKGSVDASLTPTSPVGEVWTKENNGDAPYNSAPGSLSTMHPTAVGNTGQSQPHSNMQPYLVLSFCIALQGIFPSRN
jgi:microcystin-dependent protein